MARPKGGSNKPTLVVQSQMLQPTIWNDLSSQLNNPNYWMETEWHTWSLIQYAISMFDINPCLTKNSLKSSFLRDLELIQTHFAHLGPILLAVQSLTSALTEDQTMFNHFWETHSERLMKMAIEKQVARATIMFQKSLKRSFKEMEHTSRKKLRTQEDDDIQLEPTPSKTILPPSPLVIDLSRSSSTSSLHSQVNETIELFIGNKEEGHRAEDCSHRVVSKEFSKETEGDPVVNKEVESKEAEVICVDITTADIISALTNHVEIESNEEEISQAENKEEEESISVENNQVENKEENKEDNQAENKEDNQAENKEDNQAENKEDNQAENKEDNQAENKEDNQAENKEDNQAENKEESFKIQAVQVENIELKENTSDNAGSKGEEDKVDSRSVSPFVITIAPPSSITTTTISDLSSATPSTCPSLSVAASMFKDRLRKAVNSLTGAVYDSPTQKLSQAACAHSTKEPLSVTEEDKTSDSLQITLNTPTNEDEGNDTLIDVDGDDCTEKTQSVGPTRPTKQQEEMTKKSIVEVDMLYYRPNKKSVGTILKRWAFLTHAAHYIHHQDLTETEQKNMALSLSSILDLAQDSAQVQKEGTQAFLFKEIWMAMKKDLLEKLPLSQPSQQQIRCQAQFHATYGKLDIQTFLKEIQSRVAKPPASNDLASLWRIMRRWANLVRQNSLDHLKESTSAGTEIEYFRKVWSPIFQFLFPATESIRLKIGYLDDVYPTPTKYNFKLVAQIDNRDFTLAVGECAAPDSNNYGDTLLRKGKDALDELIDFMNIPEDKRFMTWLVNIQGFSCTISTIELMANGLYVHIPRFTFCLPQKFNEVHSFIRILNSFITMKFELQRSHDTIQSYKEAGLVRSRTLSNRGKKTRWIRETWHVPKEGAESHIPRYFTSPPPFSNRRNITEIMNPDF